MEDAEVGSGGLEVAGGGWRKAGGRLEEAGRSGGGCRRLGRAGGRLEGGWRRMEGVEEGAGGWGRLEEAGCRLEEAGRGQKLVKYESGAPRGGPRVKCEPGKPGWVVPFKENTIPIRTTRIGEDPSDEQTTLSGSEARWRIIEIDR